MYITPIIVRRYSSIIILSLFSSLIIGLSVLGAKLDITRASVIIESSYVVKSILSVYLGISRST